VFWASLGTSPMQKQKKNGRYRQKQAAGAAQERHKCGFSGQIRHLPSLLCIVHIVHLSAVGSSATRNLTTTEPSESLNRRKTVDFRFQRPYATSRSFFFNKPMRAMDSRRDFTSKKAYSGYFSELGEKANSALSSRHGRGGSRRESPMVQNRDRERQPPNQLRLFVGIGA